MRAKYFYFNLILITTLLGVLFQVHLARASLAITPFFYSTDGDSNIINFYSLSKGWSFGVYDFDGQKKDGLILLQGKLVPTFEEAKFKITQEDNNYNNDYILRVIEGFDKNESLNLGGTPGFNFFFYDGSNYFTPNIIASSQGDSFIFSYDGGGKVIGTDLKMVPIPSTILILSIGLITLLLPKFKMYLRYI